MSCVLIVTKDADSRGGVASYFRLFIERYGEREPRVARFDIGSRARDYDQRRRRHISYAADYLRDLVSFRRLLRERPDVVAVQVNPSLIPVPLWRDGIILSMARAQQRRTIVFIRGWRDDLVRRLGQAPWRNLFLRTHGRANRVVALADRFANELAVLGISRERLVVSRTMFDGRQIQARECPGDVPRLLYLARLSRPKGAFDFIDALGLLRRQGHAFEANLNGHEAVAGVEERLRDAAHRQGLADRCQIGPYLEEGCKFRAYARHDVFVLPSHHEGCPNALLEAMGAGMDVVATNVGAIPEIVREGVNGQLCPPGDPAALALALQRVLNDREASVARGTANAREAACRYESTPIIAQMQELYQAMCTS